MPKIILIWDDHLLLNTSKDIKSSFSAKNIISIDSAAQLNSDMGAFLPYLAMYVGVNWNNPPIPHSFRFRNSKGLRTYDHLPPFFEVPELRSHYVWWTTPKREENGIIHQYRIFSGFRGLLLRNDKRSSDKLFWLWSSISFRLRNSERLTKNMTIFLRFNSNMFSGFLLGYVIAKRLVFYNTFSS